MSEKIKQLKIKLADGYSKGIPFESDGVSDVQIDGTSVVTDGVANIPICKGNTLGVVKIGATNGYYGIRIDASGVLFIEKATSANIKRGLEGCKPLVPSNQHESTFYGLAKAAGDATQSASNNAVGTYTEAAKASIRTMLGLQGVYEDYSSALTALGVTES